ncbi:thiamine pyrophosphate-dependent enzyme [Actinokineospora sp.]|uniref:thiamine pyrophosphate-dependent enzyme n=1 Tax=Actinokineospora sp. TaxID=1872133 RepID=UPI0040377B89
MNKNAVIRAIIAATEDHQVILFTTEAACRIAQELADRPNHFYLTGSVGLAPSIGIGIALETRRTTIVVDGYANVVRNPAGMLTAGGMADLPLVHVVLDDGLFGSAGNAATPSDRTDLCALAKASGYANVTTTARLDRFASLVRAEIATCSAPVLIRCLLTEPDFPLPRSIDQDQETHARRFQEYLAVPEWMPGRAA